MTVSQPVPALRWIVAALAAAAPYRGVSATANGGQIAFTRGRDLYVVAASGGRARKLARNFVLSGPSWARAR